MSSNQWHCYSRGIAAGGAIIKSTENGGEIIKSTESGGSVVTSTDSGGAVIQSTESGGGAFISTYAGGGNLLTASVGNTYAAGAQGTYKLGNELVTGQKILSGEIMGFTTGSGGKDGHTHTIPNYGYYITHEHEVPVPEHAHGVNIPKHTHGVNIPNHTHGVTIPNHAHQMNIPGHSHDLNLPNHEHEVLHGIFEGPTATAVTVTVDGTVIPGLGPNADEVDLIPYLLKDDSGKVLRNRWVDIRITPNSLGRIIATVVEQIFVQSRGGGSY